MNFRWHMPTEIVAAPGALDELAARIRPYCTAPLLVAGRSSARQSGALDRLRAQFPEAPLFDAVEENPSTATCDAGAALCRAHGCDGTIGVGGGSPMDAAKAIAMLAVNEGPCEQYFGKDQFAAPGLPIVCVPTTAGTGAEVTPNAVITHAGKRFKKSIAGRSMIPRLAVLDPALSVSMPPEVTRNTGLDAISQAMEGYISRNATPMGDALALEACRIAARWLPVALARPDDTEARGQLLYAAMLTGCVIAQSGTTLVHGMGYYLTLEFGLAHGLANALLLRPLFHYNAAFEPAKTAALAEALGHPAPPEPGPAAEALDAALGALFARTGLDAVGANAGMNEAPLRGFAERISADRGRFKNQPGAPSVDAVHGFFLAARRGTAAL